MLHLSIIKNRGEVSYQKVLIFEIGAIDVGITKDYFNAVSKLISARGEIAGLTKHGTTTGTNREIIVKEFLEKHIPRRLITTTGGVILGDGSPSKQIDVLINSDSALQFKECDQLYTCVDSMAAAISIKSTLDKSAIIQALDEFKSIPKEYSFAVKMNSYLNGEEAKSFISDFRKRTPNLSIMAYNGSSVDTIMDHIIDYYKVNPHIPENRRPSYIWVNGEWAIVRLDYDKKYDKLIEDGTMIQLVGSRDVYTKFDIEENPCAPYLYLIKSLNLYISRENNISFDFTEYFKN